MLFYHSYDDPPLKAVIVSGLLAAMNNFSEIEMEERGIQSLEMEDLRWVYLNAKDFNLLVIAADSKDQNSKVMRSRLNIILKLFVKNFHIDLGYWEQEAINLELFSKFKHELNNLEQQWIEADETRDLGHIMDLLGVFQQVLIIYIDLIKANITGRNFRQVLTELDYFSPQLREWYGKEFNPHAFDSLQLFVPKIDLEKNEIFFLSSPGENIVGKDHFELDPEYIKAFFFMLIQYYSDIVKKAMPLISWNDIFSTEFMPYFFSKWEYLESIGVLHDLMKTIFHEYKGKEYS